MMRNRESYVYEIFQGVRVVCEANGWKPPSASAFYNYFSKLRRLELVIFVREEEANDLPGEIKVRRFYRINSARVNDPGWRNVYAAIYPETYR